MPKRPAPGPIPEPTLAGVLRYMLEEARGWNNNKGTISVGRLSDTFHVYFQLYPEPTGDTFKLDVYVGASVSTGSESLKVASYSSPDLADFYREREQAIAERDGRVKAAYLAEAKAVFKGVFANWDSRRPTESPIQRGTRGHIRRGGLRASLLAYAREHGGITVNEGINCTGRPWPNVYAALYSAAKSGVLKRDQDGKYEFVKQVALK